MSRFVVHYVTPAGFYGATGEMSFQEAIRTAQVLRCQSDVDEAWVAVPSSSEHALIVSDRAVR